jgi:hypothetical protein
MQVNPKRFVLALITLGLTLLLTFWSDSTYAQSYTCPDPDLISESFSDSCPGCNCNVFGCLDSFGRTVVTRRYRCSNGNTRTDTSETVTPCGFC